MTPPPEDSDEEECCDEGYPSVSNGEYFDAADVVWTEPNPQVFECPDEEECCDEEILEKEGYIAREGQAFTPDDMFDEDEER